MSGFKVGDKIISMDAQGQVRLFLKQRHKAYMWEEKLISWNVLGQKRHTYAGKCEVGKFNSKFERTNIRTFQLCTIPHTTFQLLDFSNYTFRLPYTIKILVNSNSKELNKMDEETSIKTLSVLSKKPKVRIVYSPNLNILAT